MSFFRGLGRVLFTYITNNKAVIFSSLDNCPGLGGLDAERMGIYFLPEIGRFDVISERFGGWMEDGVGIFVTVCRRLEVVPVVFVGILGKLSEDSGFDLFIGWSCISPGIHNLLRFAIRC
jgi:hypothetical protein